MSVKNCNEKKEKIRPSVKHISNRERTKILTSDCVCVCTRHAQNKEIYKVAKIDLNSSRKICFYCTTPSGLCRRVDQLLKEKVQLGFSFLFFLVVIQFVRSFFYYYYFSRVCLV